jgi:2-dehydro-3-deoxygluconokinase
MLELSSAGDRMWRMGPAGDTYNTSVYLSRLGVATAYLTALGADPFSTEMRERWAAEGLDTSLVLTEPDRVPGLYAIRTDEAGERSFFYWREQSAVRRLFDLPGIDAALASAARAKLVYLSGITLSLFDKPGLMRLVELCAAVRAHGGDVAFDPNYRPRGWRSPAAAHAAISNLAPFVSVALPTFDDELALIGEGSPEETGDRWLRSGAREVVVKLGPRGCLVATEYHRATLPPPVAVKPKDTTGAGDAFNAGYLAARLKGAAPALAAAAGNRLAGEVVQHAGAIIDPAHMPGINVYTGKVDGGL